MVIVGLDVSDRKTVCNVLDPSKEGSDRHRMATVATTREGLESVLKPLGGDCVVVFEVCPQAQFLASVLRPLATDVLVANPGRIPWLFRDHYKSDHLDARKLATLVHLGELPQVHLPAGDVSAWRALIRHRQSLVYRRTSVKNQVRAILRSYAYRCPHRSCWSRVGRAWLTSLVFDDARTLMIQSLLETIDLLSQQLLAIEQQLTAIAATRPEVARLQTIPGVGPRTAEAVVAFSDDIGRFRQRKQFASYFGMTPRLDASGQVVRHGRICKRGPSVVRWVLIEAAHQTVRHCPVMRAHFARLCRSKKTRRKKAIVATGRKLLTIMFAMLRDRTDYDPDQVTRVAA